MTPENLDTIRQLRAEGVTNDSHRSAVSAIQSQP
jgi:hypothetical protein